MGRGFVIALACAVAAALVLPLPAGAQTPRTARPASKTFRGTIRPASEVEKTGASRLSRPATSTRSGPRLTVPMSMGGASTANAPRPALTEGNQGGLAAGVNLPYSSTPPDSTGAIGPNDYVEVVNSAIADYDRNLSYKGSNTLTGFLNVDPGIDYCDPQVQWDPAANRWFYLFLFCNAYPGHEDFHFGWSRTSSPGPLNVSGWCNFYIP